MTHTTQIQLFQIFRQKFGEKDAEIIVETLEKTVDNKMEAAKNTYLTKDDRMDIIREMKEDKMELLKAIKDSKIDTIKWMVGLYLSLFITLGLMIMGLYIKIGN
jgi:hypothetical protein